VIIGLIVPFPKCIETNLLLAGYGGNIMEDKQHLHLKRKEEIGDSSLGGQVSPPHNAYSQRKGPMDERESSASKNERHHNHHTPQSKITMTSTMISPSVNYNVNVQFDPATPQAGKPTRLILVVTEQKIGEPIKDFDVIHDKLMHLIIVNKEDLSHFAHIHPKLDRETGIFHIAHTFAKAGKYKMWIDAKPKGGMQILAAFAFIIEGQPIHFPAKIAHEQTRVKNVHAQGQSYQIALNCEPEQLIADRDIKMTFEIKDANGKPITNLESLMAAGGHCVIIDADGREFLHVHPAEEINDVVSWRGGPTISFLANFPKPSLYRAWGQFQHEGRLLTADFTFEVVAGQTLSGGK
jgi:hypothetical protein